ncbi:TlpA disulfide reductase family protein [Pseudobacter ginsenosidimutans]|uniref:Peroxiredoxin n=1 Tax=Pseudobacter ginsenosidimutans TaxID=661488 RepID=A0A4Q7N2U6_9BACT|nr:TlpA disulfide reductase family protein [Pseudobacter ginsenosidimutans]QEC42978.1 AhpC/TSA family protein [Pseudobacter ginsenosidimutans]RZS74328.1 peroxiredoxin [Pseudobacter ginsenosidimutans]
MKKNILILILALPLSLFSQQVSYKVRGKIDARNAPQGIYLYHGNSLSDRADTARIKKGEFMFEGSVTAPKSVNIIFQYGARQKSLNLYLEPGVITINGADSLEAATVEGGAVNAENEMLKASLKRQDQRKKDLIDVFKSLSEEKRKDSQLKAALDAGLILIKEGKRQAYIDFIRQNPGSFVSLDALKTLGGVIPDHDLVAPLFNSLAPGIQNTESGKEYARRLDAIAATTIGKMAPDFTQNDTLGNPVRLSDLRGKYVLIEFWASWCGPCRVENPVLVSIYNEYHNKNFEILGISMDDEKGKNAWLAAIRKDNLPWINVSDLKAKENIPGRLFDIKAIPQNVLVDTTGKIIGRNVKGEALRKKLNEILQ